MYTYTLQSFIDSISGVLRRRFYIIEPCNGAAFMLHWVHVRRKIKFNRLALLTKPSSAWLGNSNVNANACLRVCLWVRSVGGKKVEPTANFHKALFLLWSCSSRVNGCKSAAWGGVYNYYCCWAQEKLTAGMLRNSNSWLFTSLEQQTPCFV